MATNLRTRIDLGFATLARIVFRHRLKTLLVVALIVGGLVSQLHTLKMDNSRDVFFHKDDPALIDYNAFLDQFGRDELVAAAIQPPEVFDAAFLKKLRAFHEALENEVPYLEKVTSLINVRDTRSEGDELIVEDLLKEFPGTPQEMARFKQRVLASKLYPNFYISEDGRTTAVLIRSVAYSPAIKEGDLAAGFGEEKQDDTGTPPARAQLSEAENRELVWAVKAVAERFRGPDFRIYLSGGPVLGEYFNAAIKRDVGLFMTYAFIAFAIILLVLFRRLSAALLPLLVVVLSLLSTLSLMAIFGAPFTSISSILPSFIMSVGVGSSVHVLAIFFRRYKESGDKEDAIVHTFAHSGFPIFMTGVTTAAGLLSFATAGLAPVADLGRFGSAGVMVILFFDLTLLPALIALLPLRPMAKTQGENHGRRIDALLVWIAGFSVRRARSIVLISAVIAVAAGAGLTQQSFSHSIVKWLPHESDVRQSIELMDKEMKGAFSMEVVADLGRENGLYEPEIMNKLQQLARYAEAYKDRDGIRIVGKTASLVNVVKETHQALNENKPEFYALPNNRELMAQELLLFENSGSDDMEELVDSQFSKARLTLRVLVRDASEYRDFVSSVGREAERLFGPETRITVTGAVKLFTQTIQLVMESMARSYVIAGVTITLLMILMMGSLRIGLLSMIPNVAPILITLGVMGWIGIRLDMSNMLLGTVAIGLAVDDTIHFFHNFRSNYTRSKDTAVAVRETLLGTGRAILFTTLILVTGFWLFMFASLYNLIQFGFLIGVALIIALLADLFLAPAMMELIARTNAGRNTLLRWGAVEAAKSAA